MCIFKHLQKAIYNYTSFALFVYFVWYLKNKQSRINYQLEVSITSGKVVRVELLILTVQILVFDDWQKGFGE